MRVADNVFALDASKGSYVYVITGKEVVLIDTGLPHRRQGILKELQSMNIRMEDIKHILLTHHDIDHVGNAGFLQKKTGCNVWASKQDLPYICGERTRYGVKRVIEFLVRIARPINIDVYMENATVGDVRVIPTPGHTPGHVCLLYKDILFAGDLVHLKKGRLEPYPSFWNWDTSALMDSISKIAPLSFKWICPAHGTPLEKKAFLKLLV
ncbi:metallo-beta-lactamase [Lucifera butyrica]|uniref:Metallo-beta-lactamase n=1 Tax=Lucifera butyrica TaxID=1351585 RepID=A0A498R9D8_9FIRM|nr:MBL fold metallo-hydrolase [Lucifera butyrica]VBB07550.1 metallo-beta-lactamase [Lucifera butyrica]